jgi:hypothetical protein
VGVVVVPVRLAVIVGAMSLAGDVARMVELARLGMGQLIGRRLMTRLRPLRHELGAPRDSIRFGHSRT